MSELEVLYLFKWRYLFYIMCSGVLILHYSIHYHFCHLSTDDSELRGMMN